MDFAQLILIAILIEAIWENCKMIWEKGKFNVNMLGVLLLSILVCVLARIGIFSLVGISLYWSAIDWTLTGIIVSR